MDCQEKELVVRGMGFVWGCRPTPGRRPTVVVVILEGLATCPGVSASRATGWGRYIQD